MRELTVRIRFTRHSLGNVKSGAEGRFLFARNGDGFVLFMPTWHRENLGMAAQVLNRHQDEVAKVCWDIRVDGDVLRDSWYKRFCGGGGPKKRYALHESFWPGQVVGLHCVVPSSIGDDDLRRLMTLAGQYRGLSPWKPGEFGLFEVDQILPRRLTLPAHERGEGGAAGQAGRVAAGIGSGETKNSGPG